MKKILLIAVLALVAGVMQASATITTPVAISVAGVVVVSSPTTGNVTIIRGCRLCNDTAAGLCVQFYQGGNIAAANSRGMLCAAAYTCSDTPQLANANAAAPMNGLAGFFGEQFTLTGQFTVASATATAAASGGATLTCDYIKPVK